MYAPRLTVVLLCAVLLPVINCLPSSDVQRALRLVKRQAAAPLELVSLGSHQYYFSNIEHKLNWESAKKFCTTNGLEFSSIDSEQENELVLKHAQRLYARKNWGIWLGASDTGSESNWVWDSSQQTLTYTNFDAEQPGGGPQENCLLLHRSDGRWNDFDCNREFNFLCKKPGSAAAPAVQENVIQLELVELGRSQFYFSNRENKMNWADAKKFCQQNGLEFATIESEAENKLVNTYIQRLYDRKLWGSWLGASDLGKEGNWVWDSSQQTLTYDKFDADQPSGGQAENCLLMHRSDGRWNDFDCNREFNFICKKTNSATQAGPDVTDPDADKIHFVPELELVKLGNHQFYFSNRENKLKWSSAREFCTSHNLEFARINNARENGLVLAHAQKLYERRLWGIWLGASDTSGEGNWMWDTNKQAMKFHNWDADQPGGGPRENCLLLHRSDGAWNDFDCEREFNFVCKKSSPETINLSAVELVRCEIVLSGERPRVGHHRFGPAEQTDPRAFPNYPAYIQPLDWRVRRRGRRWLEVGRYPDPAEILKLVDVSAGWGGDGELFVYVCG